MNKIILVITAIIIVSCSSDTSPAKVEAIIGKWKLSKEVYYYPNNTSIERVSDNCQSISSTEYKSNNTISFVSYESSGNTNCTLQPNNWEYAKWQNLGNNIYKFTSKISGQSEEIYNITIEFQDSNVLIIKGNSSGVYNGQYFDYSKEYYTKI